MALENLVGSDKYLTSLVRTNPDGDLDPKSEGDDHLRGIKNALLNTFPSLNAPVTLTPLQLNNAGAQKLHIGQIGMFIWAVNIVGWEVLDGHSIAVATYPDFFAVTGLTSPYTLPDMRGEFLRMLSLGRAGVDVGRTLLSAQGSRVKPHTHPITSTVAADDGVTPPTALELGIGTGTTIGAAGWAAANTGTVHHKISQYTGDQETAPRNVAVYPAVWCGMHT